MSFLNLTNPRLAMLLACGNPGSAAAYLADTAVAEATLVQRENGEAAVASTADAAATADHALSDLVQSGRVLVLP